MTKEQIEFSGIMEEYHFGNRELAQTKVLNLLEQYVYSIIHRQYPTYVKFLEDMSQEAKLWILLALPKYNPEKAAPITYFRPHIVHGIQEYLNRMINNTSRHYSLQINRIKKAEEELERLGEAVSISKISAITGLRTEQIIKVRNIQNVTDQELFDSTDTNMLDKKIHSYEESPEDVLLKKELTETLKEAVNQLPEEERKIVLLYFGEEKERSFLSIAKQLEIKVDTVMSRYNRAIIKLRNQDILQLLCTDHMKHMRTKSMEEELVFTPVEDTNQMLDDLAGMEENIEK